MAIKENAKNKDVWIRGLFILIYGVIFYFLFALIWLVVIFQFIMKLITTGLNEQLLDFCDSLNKYVSQILLYITFKSEERPFPFSPWPENNTGKLMAAKVTKDNAKKSIKDSKGNTVAIFDYYYKKWMPLIGDDAVKFGKKKNSTTGLNTMCLAGVSLWIKQYETAKKEIQNITDRVISGDLLPENVEAEEAKIRKTREKIEPTKKGFETKKELLEYIYKVDEKIILINQ